MPFATPADETRLFTSDFVLYLAAMAATTLATQIQAAAVGYQLYQITHDPLSLGMLGLAEALPFITIAPAGGHVADSFDRRRISMTAFATMALAAAGFLLITHRTAATAPAHLRFAIYGLVVAGGIARGFLQPARVALSAQLVPRILYARAVTFRTALFQLCAVAGPAVGGILYAWTGGSGAYAATIVLLLIAFATTAAIRAPRPLAPRATVRFVASVREGVHFLFADPILWPAFGLDLFAVLFGGATALLPLFANDILHVGARGFGLLRAAPAVGALIASAIIAWLPPFQRAGRALLLTVAAFGCCMIAFAFSRWYLLSLVLLALSGAFDMVSVVVRSTLLQLRVPEGMLGRVASINQIFIGSSNEIGAFESGLAARLLGAVPAVALGGMVTLIVVLFVAQRAPALKRLGPLAS